MKFSENLIVVLHWHCSILYKLSSIKNIHAWNIQFHVERIEELRMTQRPRVSLKSVHLFIYTRIVVYKSCHTSNWRPLPDIVAECWTPCECFGDQGINHWAICTEIISRVIVFANLINRSVDIVSSSKKKPLANGCVTVALQWGSVIVN